MKRSRAAIGTAALTSAVTSFAMLAAAPSATAAEVSEPIATGLIGPLQMDVAGKRVIVAESFAGLLSRVRPNGSTRTLHAEEKGEVAGVAIRGKKIAFLTTSYTRKPASRLKLRLADGSVDTIANIQAFEEESNPDGDTSYGFQGLSDRCESKLPKNAGLRPYDGIVESHPYGLADAPDGGWYVADAAGNAILHVSKAGDVSTVAVLPSQDLVVTRKQAEATGMPKCVVGKTFAFEAVPTDVEVLDSGELVVSLLPGGPEDPSLGARGSVVSVDPSNGASTVLADGFAGATNVAVSGSDIFVAELFGNRVSHIDETGDVTTVIERRNPAALDVANGALYAAIDVFNQKRGGRIVVVTLDAS